MHHSTMARHSSGSANTWNSSVRSKVATNNSAVIRRAISNRATNRKRRKASPTNNSQTNSSQANNDGDAFGDLCDNCPDTPNPDDQEGELGTACSRTDYSGAFTCRVSTVRRDYSFALIPRLLALF